MPRKSGVSLGLAAIWLCLTHVLSGCTTLVVPPSATREPVAVFVVDQGRTSSLVVPDGDDGMLRYAYGDWNYYALRETDLLHGIAALLWPTQGALGRAHLKGPATGTSLRRQLPSAWVIHTLTVERVRARSFVREMETLYASHRHTEVVNVPYGLSFVHHPQPYTYFWNSNHAVASWLRELGCETRGPAFRASWRVAEPTPGPTAVAMRSTRSVAPTHQGIPETASVRPGADCGSQGPMLVLVSVQSSDARLGCRPERVSES